MEYYWRDNKHEEFGVLVSGGFGAGFSTWNDPRLTYDKRIIELFLAHELRADNDNLKNILNSYGYEDVYISNTGLDNLTLFWVPVNTYWRINEYDGAESLEIFDPNNWNIYHI